MKKIIMACTVAAMLASSVMCVSAENLPEYTPTEDGTYVVDAYNTNTVADAYYGVVVVKGTNAAGVDLSDTDSILYIDQVTADAEGNVVIDEFMSKIDPTDESFTGGTIYIGGEGLETATAIGYIVAGEEEEETFTISGTVAGNLGATAPTVVASDGTTDYDATVDAEGAFTVDVPVGATYTVTVTKTGYLSYTKANIATEISAIEATIKPGNVNGDSSVNLTDLSSFLDAYNTAVETIEKDYDESGAVNLSDLSPLLTNYNQGAISE